MEPQQDHRLGERRGRRGRGGSDCCPLAHPSQNAGIRIFRKGANFTEPGQARSAGLIFLSHQADIGAQFTPLQQQLDEMDDLNTWTTATGSAEFALLPGFTETTWLGQSLLDGPMPLDNAHAGGSL